MGKAVCSVVGEGGAVLKLPCKYHIITYSLKCPLKIWLMIYVSAGPPPPPGFPHHPNKIRFCCFVCSSHVCTE